MHLAVVNFNSLTFIIVEKLKKEIGYKILQTYNSSLTDTQLKNIYKMHLKSYTNYHSIYKKIYGSETLPMFGFMKNK